MKQVVFVIGEDKDEVSEVMGKLWRNGIPAMSRQLFSYYLPSLQMLEALLLRCDLTLFLKDWDNESENHFLHQLAKDSRMPIFHDVENLITAVS